MVRRPSAKRPVTAYYPVHQATMHDKDLETGVQPCATRARYPVLRPGKNDAEGAEAAQAQTPFTVQAPI